MGAESAVKHVIIVGGGFAGVGCAHGLAGQRGVRVTLIDRNNFHQFQPLLYQVATSLLAPGDAAFSLRKLFLRSANVDVKQAEVASVDPARKTVTTATGEVYQGDYLVLAAGSQANFFKTPGADQNTFPLYSLNDAERLRSRILQVFEDADRDPRLLDEGALNFVIVGGGPTGVEMAGALAGLIHETMAGEYRDLAVSAARIHLVDHGHALLGAFSAGAHDYAAKVLQRAGVTLRLGTGVTEVGTGHVVLSDGSRIKTRTVVWAGGLKAAPLADRAGLRQGRGGRVDVLPDLSVEGLPGVFALGDFANVPQAGGGSLPQLGSVTLQCGQWTAGNILADLAGKPRTAFHYHDKGIMAMISRGAAVAEVGEHRHELHGAVGFAAWLGVHLYLLSGVRTKVEAFLTWGWDFFTKTRGPQLLDRSDVQRINWEDDEAPTPSKASGGVGDPGQK
jgi:NADH:ubiquinone reductase (H+-translocating)